MRTVPILERTIKCPKCENKTMRKSLESEKMFGSNYGREWKCDHCNLYFSLYELINHWNYDAADSFDTESDKRIFRAGRHSTNRVPYPIVLEKSFYELDEPVWWTNKERQDAYEMVDRMFTGVPEWEEGTTNKGIDIGIEGWPI